HAVATILSDCAGKQQAAENQRDEALRRIAELIERLSKNDKKFSKMLSDYRKAIQRRQERLQAIEKMRPDFTAAQQVVVAMGNLFLPGNEEVRQAIEAHEERLHKERVDDAITNAEEQFHKTLAELEAHDPIFYNIIFTVAGGENTAHESYAAAIRTAEQECEGALERAYRERLHKMDAWMTRARIQLRIFDAKDVSPELTAASSDVAILCCYEFVYYLTDEKETLESLKTQRLIDDAEIEFVQKVRTYLQSQTNA
ncbi:MAG: hypothetical protein ACRD3W_29625, partial [Terriglobales bacterium]